MNYPYKYPEVYAELARQGKQKLELANKLGLTLSGLRYKQSQGDFTGDEMKITADFLGKRMQYLFGLNETSEEIAVLTEDINELRTS